MSARLVREHIDAFRQLAAAHGGGWAGVYDLLHERGVEYEGEPPGELSDHVGPPRDCFKTAFLAALADESLTYVEGYAVPSDVPLPIHHAWVVDADGAAVELTWPEPGNEYLGIPFESEPLRAATVERGVYGMLDNPAVHEDPARFVAVGAA